MICKTYCSLIFCITQEKKTESSLHYGKQLCRCLKLKPVRPILIAYHISWIPDRADFLANNIPNYRNFHNLGTALRRVNNLVDLLFQLWKHNPFLMHLGYLRFCSYLCHLNLLLCHRCLWKNKKCVKL